ncbi:MAG: hypothetical protein AAFO94_22475, partial [Bacteroidota bacterium]
MQLKVEKNYYRQFCASTPSLPVFFQPWLLDAVCEPDGWHVIVLLDKELPVAALPYFKKQKALFRYITMPHPFGSTGG